MKGVHWAFLISYLILAAYMINIPFNFIPIPDSVTEYRDWISFVSGIFLVWGAYVYYRTYRYAQGPMM